MKNAVMELFFGPLSGKKEALLPGALPVQRLGAGAGGGLAAAWEPQLRSPQHGRRAGTGSFHVIFLTWKQHLWGFLVPLALATRAKYSRDKRKELVFGRTRPIPAPSGMLGRQQQPWNQISSVRRKTVQKPRDFWCLWSLEGSGAGRDTLWFQIGLAYFFKQQIMSVSHRDVVTYFACHFLLNWFYVSHNLRQHYVTVLSEINKENAKLSSSTSKTRPHTSRKESIPYLDDV